MSDGNPLGVAALARFGGDVLDLRKAVKVQECRCAGCGQVLELGSAVLTSIDFPGDRRVPAAAHAECRDGIAMVGDWENLKETIRLQIGPDGVTAASWTIMRAYRAYFGEEPPGLWPS